MELAIINFCFMFNLCNNEPVLFFGWKQLTATKTLWLKNEKRNVWKHYHLKEKEKLYLLNYSRHFLQKFLHFFQNGFAAKYLQVMIKQLFIVYIKCIVRSFIHSINFQTAFFQNFLVISRHYLIYSWNWYFADNVRDIF